MVVLLTHIHVYRNVPEGDQLTAWTRDLLDKLRVNSSAQEIHCLLWDQNVT